jgi:heptosyltransferase-2
MLPALRRRYPDASIEVLAGPWNRMVFEEMREVDRVHVSRVNRFARRGRFGWILSTFAWGIRLRRRKIDLGIDVRGEFPHTIILWLSGARRRLGWACGGGGFLLTERVVYVPDRPEVESRLALLAALGIRPAHGQTWRPGFSPSEMSRRGVSERLSGLSRGAAATGPRIVLHVGAGTQAKAWPAEHWRSLAVRLVKRLGAQIILVGGPADRAVAGFVLHGIPRLAVADWTGQLTVVELAAVLEQADLMIGADSGPAHVAAAVDTPVITLFSGTNSPAQWQPSGSEVTVLRHAVPCSPCHRQKCPFEDHPCMAGLAPERVAAMIGARLRELSPTKRTQPCAA